jgi:hypothetical protein
MKHDEEAKRKKNEELQSVTQEKKFPPMNTVIF